MGAMVGAAFATGHIMQARIARSRPAGEPPDVLLTPHLGQMGSYEYHRAAPAIEEGRDAMARLLPTIGHALRL